VEKPEGKSNLQSDNKGPNFVLILNMLKNLLAKRWKVILIVVIVLAGGLFFYFKNKNVVVKTTTVQKGNLKEELVLSGEILATNYAKLSFETSGKIVYVGVKEGDKVAKGKLLTKLDTTVLNSSYQIAMSNLRAAEATAQNVLDQVKDHSSDETFVQKDLRTAAEANKDKAYEAVIVAKRNLDGGSLYAPFSGIITDLSHPFTGVYTGLGSVEAEIIDPSTMYFNVLADQTEVLKLSKGQKVEIVLDSFDEKSYKGIIENISFTPKIGESGSVYSVKAYFKEIDLTSSQFKISMTGDAKFITSEKNDVLYIQNNYIKQDKTGKYLKTDRNKGKVYIESGIESADFTEIIGEVKEGLVIYD
jgi:HlyD family secretion protein